MGETYSGGAPKKGLSRKVIAILIGLLLVIGGSVLGYMYLTGSAKAKYFTAEKNTIDFMVDKFTERYQPEMDWLEQSKDHPTETTFELSAEYNDPYGGAGYGMISPQQIINNSTITLKTQLDRDKKQLAADINADFGGMKIGDVKFYMDSDKGILGLPFLKESLQLKDKDLATLLHEIDPQAFTGDEKIDFADFFKSMNGFLTEADKEYFKEEYAMMIYDKLPDDAFDKTDESITVDSKNFETEKLTLHLSEQQVKDVLTSVMEKMKNDKRIKEIIKEQIELQSFGMPNPGMVGGVEQILADYEDSLDQAIDQLQDFQIPNGLTSIIWVKNDLIVKRDFTLNMGPTKDQLATLTVNGTHLLSDTEQKFDYEFGIGDSSAKQTMTITGDLTYKDNKADDSIKLQADGFEFSYNGKETLKDGKRDFERVFSLKNAMSDIGSLTWSGQATYNNDQMNAEHTFSVETPDISQDMFSLHIATDGKLIKQVDEPSQESVKDLGSMSVDEIGQYVQTEIQPQFQQWIMGIMGAGGGFGF